MVPTPKLTKRQKKGIAFRERKHNKGQDNQSRTLEDKVHVSSLEDQAIVVVSQGPQVHQVGAKVFVGRRNTGKEREERVVVARKKRKRQAGEEEKGAVGDSDKPESKRRKGSDGGSPPVLMEEHVEDDVEAGETGMENEKAKQRFILFLGNLKYTTTPEVIEAHFSACVPPPTVRLLTPKSSTKSQKSVVKSKGCAFLEFTHRGALQQALKLHHSQLDERQINVELTAGGGGKGLTRMKKLKERNKELEEQRRKRQGSAVDVQPSGTQRFSATSGAEKTHTHKRTWTVGDVEEEMTHRGSKKRPRGSKKRGSLVKDFRTGVNAIPVG